jgi:hypothetical protein
VQKELTLQEFYASNPRRARSHEMGYGSLWRAFAPVPAYRLAWVESTGELSAVELSQADEHKDSVEVPGVLWNWPQVEACLAGWPESAYVGGGRWVGCSGQLGGCAVSAEASLGSACPVTGR